MLIKVIIILACGLSLIVPSTVFAANPNLYINGVKQTKERNPVTEFRGSQAPKANSLLWAPKEPVRIPIISCPVGVATAEDSGRILTPKEGAVSVNKWIISFKKCTAQNSENSREECTVAPFILEMESNGSLIRPEQVVFQKWATNTRLGRVALSGKNCELAGHGEIFGMQGCLLPEITKELKEHLIICEGIESILTFTYTIEKTHVTTAAAAELFTNQDLKLNMAPVPDFSIR